MKVAIGVNPLLWSNDDMPEVGGATPLAVCLQEAAAAGYQGIELGHKFPRDAKALRPLLQRYSLALISGWYSGRLHERSVACELEAMASHVELLAACGCQVLIYAEISGGVHSMRTTPLSQRPRLRNDEWPRFADRLSAMAAALARQGIRLAYHHHMGTVVESEDDIDRLMALTDPAVGLLLDTGHIAYAGGDSARAAQRHGARIAHVHLKDVRQPVLTDACKRDRPFLAAVLDGVFTVPGDGTVDYDPMLRALRAAHYAGWLVVEAELDSLRVPSLAFARLGWGHVTAAARRAGFHLAASGELSC